MFLFLKGRAPVSTHGGKHKSAPMVRYIYELPVFIVSALKKKALSLTVARHIFISLKMNVIEEAAGCKKLNKNPAACFPLGSEESASSLCFNDCFKQGS